MKNDYLWDGSGEPDPEIQKLEAALGSLRHHSPAPDFPEIAGTARPPVRARWFEFRLWPALAGAAAGLLLIAVLHPLMPRSNPVMATLPGWEITTVAGAPRVGTQLIGAGGGKATLAAGQTLETDSRSQASLLSEQVGEIGVDPSTRLRVLDLGSGTNRLALDRGVIHVAIWAPPGEFVVDTPSARAVDLGCTYTLQVDDSGNGLLRTTLGWVGFKLNGHEAFIPAGAACATRPKTGPGTPYFEDAAAAFRAALEKLDALDIAADDHVAALQVVLTQSRKRDALTLWHLLSRVPESDRGRVFDRLAQLVPPPQAVTREGILRLDQPMLDQWWNALGLGDVGLWRHWERSWSEKANSN